MHLITCLALLTCLWLTAPLCAQSDTEQERSAATLKNGLAEAAKYEIRPATGDRTPALLNPVSVLKWQNTVNKSVHGNIFVWLKAGRPEAIASIYQFYSPKTSFEAEFQSLAVYPLQVQRDGVAVWSSKEAGVVLKPFNEDATPGDSKPQRLIAMRKLADRFTGNLVDWDKQSYRLRLMPKPLYRYESTDPEVLDGGLFSLTYTTDPEVLVVVEARKSPQGFRWMYGFGRMNVGEITVFEDEKTVWSAPRLEHPYHFPTGSYTLMKDLPLPETAVSPK